MMGSRDLQQHSYKRRGSLVGYFTVALSILLIATVIYQKFLLDNTSLYGAIDNLPTTAATIKIILSSEVRFAPRGSTRPPPENEIEHDESSNSKLLISSPPSTFFNSSTNPKLLISTPPTFFNSSTHTIPQSEDHSHHNPIRNLGLSSSTSAVINPHSCLSRQESPFYQQPSPHKSSSRLRLRLRSYELLHRQCGPYTAAYNRTIKSLQVKNNDSPSLAPSPSTTSDNDLCRYVIWTPTEGLGNQIISLSSTFLYALLTFRVLLVNFGPDISNLFCDPFPGSSWLLPHDFPYHTNQHFNTLKSLKTFIHENNVSSPSSIINVDLRNRRVKSFHSNKVQTLIHKIPFLIIKSNLYYTPALFMTPFFTPELHKLFPQQTLVFHHLGRYLFQPSNQAWTKIKHHYNTQLAHSDIKLGLQIRVFWYEQVTQETVLRQLQSCTQTHNLLPRPDRVSPEDENLQTSKVVLVASLSGGYAQKLREVYETGEDGEVKVRVYQVSSDEKQKFRNKSQNMKAWVEMYLLSLCDELVTTGESTFGYVAQGLGGVKPVVMGIGKNRYGGRGECFRARTIDPCFMVTSKGYFMYDKWKRKVYPRDVKSCEDRVPGIRLREYMTRH